LADSAQQLGFPQSEWTQPTPLKLVCCCPSFLPSYPPFHSLIPPTFVPTFVHGHSSGNYYNAPSPTNLHKPKTTKENEIQSFFDNLKGKGGK
jgi:hypothetical protein